MDLEILKMFLGWCTVINGGLLVFVALWSMAAPDLLCRLQTTFFPMTRERYDQAMYLFIGVFKIAFLVFNLVPYTVLTIIA